MPRFLLIGLDGAEPSLVEPWMEEGRLPNLARLRESGAYLPCASVAPPVTYPAWTTCVTGVNPSRHGIFDFTEVVPGEQRIEFVNSTFRRAPAIWNVLSEAGKRCCVLGVPGTWPPEPINGVMVSGFDSPVATAVDMSCVCPPERFDDVRDWRFADFQESDIGEGWHATALERLHAKIDAKERIACGLLREEPWDFSMVVFGESDTVAHHFWLFHDPESPRHRPGFETAIRDIYERLDVAVGRLVKAAGDDVTVGIVSDHGFGGTGDGVVHLNNWLAEQGDLNFAKGGESVLKRIALKAVPARWRGALFRRLKGLATAAESKSRFAGIHWQNTRAWSEELNYFPSIRVNLKGREPFGQVDPADYAAYCDDLCARLAAFEHVAAAHRRDDLYDGPCIESAPDIIVELALENGYSHSCLRSRGGPAFRRIAADEVFGGKERGMTGNHRPTGVLFLSKPTPSGFASLQDVAPTVLAELGVPAPPMDGTSLLEPATTGATDWKSPDRTSTQDGEKVVEERLRQLGYFE